MRISSSRFVSSKSAFNCIIICGGGPVGASVALHLAMKGIKNISVIEKDQTYSRASCMLSAGGIRQQFSLPENILMSKYGIEFMKNIASLQVDDEIPNIHFRENGYLFLASESDILKQNHNTQKSCGVDWIDLHPPENLQVLFPWLNTENIALGSFSRCNEGYFDPWAFLIAMKKKAMALGVQFTEGHVEKLNLVGKGDSSIKINSISVDCKGKKRSIPVRDDDMVVNAAGAWAGHLLDSSIDSFSDVVTKLPVKRKKRCIFTVHCRSKTALIPPQNTPLVIDPSGVYFRPEGRPGQFLMGVSPDEIRDRDCVDEDLNCVDHELFDDIIWPHIANRVKAFEEIKVVSSWAGFYDYNILDQNAIIGLHSDISNLMLCNGFSGHGLQHAPATGRAVAELLTSDLKTFETIDLSRFSFERVVSKQPLYEAGIV